MQYVIPAAFTVGKLSVILNTVRDLATIAELQDYRTDMNRISPGKTPGPASGNKPGLQKGAPIILIVINNPYLPKDKTYELPLL